MTTNRCLLTDARSPIRFPPTKHAAHYVAVCALVSWLYTGIFLLSISEQQQINVCEDYMSLLSIDCGDKFSFEGWFAFRDFLGDSAARRMKHTSS